MDFEAITQERTSEKPNDQHAIIYGKDNLFIEPGAKMRACVINAEDGPVYIGPNVDLQEGAMVHGTHAFCENAVLNMGAKMRGDSTVGPFSKVGGEVGNSVIQGYSNKGHDGYLGNSVVGYWLQPWSGHEHKQPEEQLRRSEVVELQDESGGRRRLYIGWRSFSKGRDDFLWPDHGRS